METFDITCLASGDIRCRGDWKVEESCAPHHRLYFIRGGEAHYFEAERKTRLESGMLYLFPVGRRYRMRHDPAKPLRCLWFHLTTLPPIVDGLALSIHHGDSALIEDVTFDNIRVEDARQKLIDFTILLGNYGTDRPSPEQRAAWQDVGGAWDGVLNVPLAERAAFNKGRGMIRNIHIKNLQIVGGMLPFSILSGFSEERPIENVVIEGMTYMGQPIRNETEGKFSVSHVKGLVFK